MNMLPWPQIAIPAGVLVLVALLAVLLTRHRILKKVTYMLDALEDKETNFRFDEGGLGQPEDQQDPEPNPYHIPERDGRHPGAGGILRTDVGQGQDRHRRAGVRDGFRALHQQAGVDSSGSVVTEHLTAT